ncbi:hypothetical protein [Desulfosporosinus metallidurans]|uniref:HNH endonuclease n=1 Tax=Desulfosporosinus metallidurans TaxID=1888891 RepID=A0A1Q8QZI7_9FIRM|nr:hypothetical protein [Desulfosporosinus metallidurans]OLN32600.1 hypothetical protein DSOL_1351 [Desulfosporosinus metallidurans]
MHYVYEFIPHEIETMQEYIDYIFDEVWCKAPSRQYRITLFNKNTELKAIITNNRFLATKTGKLFVDQIKAIYAVFKTLSQNDIDRLARWFKANNHIEALCGNQPGEDPVTYEELKQYHHNLAVKLEVFYKFLWNSNIFSLQAIKSRIGKISDHYSKFILKNTERICPFCGIHRIKGEFNSKREDYDHYLPKDIYPFNSVNLKNLAPTCMECNRSYKSAKDPLRDLSGSRRKTFYSYMAMKPPINIELHFLNGIVNLIPDNLDLRISCEGHEEEVQAWREIFSLDERYKAIYLDKHTTNYWFMQIEEMAINKGYLIQEALEELNRYARHSPLQEINFLKVPFLEACEKNNFFGSYSIR